MAHDDGRDATAGGAGVPVDVGAADADGLHANADLLLLGLRNRDVPKLELQGSGVNQRFHDGDLHS